MITVLFFDVIFVGLWCFLSLVSLPSIDWHITFVVLVILNLGDIITTQRSLGRRWHREGNPFVRFLFKKIGFWKTMLVGKGILFVIVLPIWKFLSVSFQLSAVTMFFFVVMWNWWMGTLDQNKMEADNQTRGRA